MDPVDIVDAPLGYWSNLFLDFSFGGSDFVEALGEAALVFEVLGLALDLAVEEGVGYGD